MTTTHRFIVSAVTAGRAVNVGVMVTAGLGATLVTMTLVTVVGLVFVGWFPLQAVAVIGAYVAPTTIVTALICTWGCIRKQRRPDDATRACLTAGLTGGILESLLGYVAVLGTLVLVEPIARPGDALGLLLGAIVAVIVGLVVGSPIGLMISVILIKPIKLACGRLHAHDSLARTAVVCGSWFAIACSIGSALLGVSCLAIGSDGIQGAHLVLKTNVAAAVIGLLVYVVAKLELHRRKRWLDRVREGREIGWVLVPAGDETVDAVTGLRPFTSRDVEPVRMVLATTLAGIGPGAYRSAEHLVPVATVS